MKICPKCQQTYTDENLNFCLNDGAILTQTGSGGVDNSLPETVMIQPPRATDPNQQFGINQSFGNEQPQMDWDAPQQQQFSMQPQKSSKRWLWVVGILGALVLICGGGLAAFFVWVSNLEPKTFVSNNSSATPTASPTVAGKKVEKYDMSQWETGANEYETASYDNGEFTMTMLKDEFFYVFVADETGLRTQDATTKLTVKNPEAKPAKYGFGLLVHSNSTPLDQDYAFVINSERKQFRVVEHTLKSEKVLSDWKPFSAIKTGNAENVLEVRDEGGKMKFYINGQLATTIDDKKNNSDGVAGIYTSDKIPIVFSNLTVEK